MKTLSAVVSLKDALFAPGTVDQPFVWSVTKDGVEVASASTQVPTAKFADLDVGAYVVTVSKLGFEAKASFDVVEDQVTLQVPDSITITLE